MIPFNKPYLTGKELSYISDALLTGKISGNGKYTNMCQNYFEDKYNFKKTLLTTSCTDALEMAAILIDIKPGDEVILPSFTFVSTANAFVLRGAKLIFVDSLNNNPNIDPSNIEALITKKTKAIIVVHYAGVSCKLDEIKFLAEKYNLFLIEDAAQAIDSFFRLNSNVQQPLGSIGHLAAFSFHETKNIISGEGGMLVINDERFIKRAEIIWEKGTNRSAFFRGEINKYGWVDIGSSYLPSELIAAFLWAQLQELDTIQNKRRVLWENYYSKLEKWSTDNNIMLPQIPQYATNNAHMFYIVTNDQSQRSYFIDSLKNKGINSVFHYMSLHKSDYFRNKHDDRILYNSDRFTDCLIRLPLYFELSISDISYICSSIISM